VVRICQIAPSAFVVSPPPTDCRRQENRLPARRIVIALVVLLVAIGAGRVEAEPITLSFGFPATGFESGAPVDPVTGSFTITFDNSASILNQTTGLTYHNLNLVLDSAPAFDYGHSGDGLTLGALASGGANTVGTGENDFFFSILNVSTSPVAGPVLVYSQANIFRPFTGTFVLTPFATPTPEPRTVGLTVASAVGIAWITRRRRLLA